MCTAPGITARSGNTRRDPRLRHGNRDTPRRPEQVGSAPLLLPTDVALTFPALFHATLELDSNRKLLSADSELNPAVFVMLASFYANFLLEMREAGNIANPLRHLHRAATFLPTLTRFEALVYEQGAQLPLIPTYGGGFETAAKTRVEPPAFASYLPARLFPELARVVSEADREVITLLKRAGADLH